MNGDVSLYFHVPFCTRKCDYCHFYVIPDQERDKNRLAEGFRLEWQQKLPLLANKDIVSVYFGGGTPSLFGPERISEVLSRIPISDSAEITLEANPEDITLPLMTSYASAGINRVSIGIQSLDDALLQRLGRIHSAKRGLDAVCITAEAGICNISIDLMYDLPGQTLHHWETTLDEVCKLPIAHLSLYNLTIEPHTVFFKHQDVLKKIIPDAEVSLSMYEMAIAKLQEAGLLQYEISAFAKEGFISRHNTGYWLGRPFLGFGPSAFSDWTGRRFRNVANLNKYLRALEDHASPVDFDEKLEPQARRRELFVIAIRLLQGVDLAAFEKQHGPLDDETKEVISFLADQRMLTAANGRVSLTKQGILFYDTIASDLI